MLRRHHSLGGVEEMGDPAAPEGSPLWCKALYNTAIRYKHDAETRAAWFKDTLQSLREGERWRQLADREGRPFLSWEDFCQCREPYGLGMSMAQVAAILDEPDGSTRTVAAVLRAGPGRPPNAERNADDYQHYPRQKHNSADHVKQRLREADPEMHARVERGEISANAAAVEKGWRKPRSAYADLCAAWRRASEEERAAFEGFIADWRRGKVA